MEQKYISESVYREHSKMCDERFRRDKEDIDRISGDVKDIKELTVEIAALVKKNDEALENQNDRIARLEHKPSLWMDRIVSALISTLVAFLVTSVLSGGAV